jgi:AraC-like DNA-binding protein
MPPREDAPSAAPGAPAALPPPSSAARTRDGYAEHAPDAALAPWVECFWSRREGLGGDAPGGSAEWRVLPDGCIDILVSFGEAGPRLAGIGAMTRPVVVPRAPADIVAVRFRPGRAASLLGIPAAEITDRNVELDLLWRDQGELRDRLEGASTLEARIAVLARAIAARAARVAPPPPLVGEAVSRIARAGGDLAIATLGPSLGVTRQHLARAFAAHVGITPKMLARIARLRGVMELLRARAPLDWATLAAGAGYFDQPHLVAEFRALAGVTPTEWREGAGAGSERAE